jgi:protein SCO1/2
VNQDAQPFGSEQLAGKIWIADFIFTSCPGPCPIISTRMSELQKPLAKSDVHFVSVSVDPEKDTPEVLRAYADKLRKQPLRWDFLTGQRAAIYSLSKNGPYHPIRFGGSPRNHPRLLRRARAGRRHEAPRRYEPSPARAAEVNQVCGSG